MRHDAGHQLHPAGPAATAIGLAHQ
jgi:hypothetical protein